MQKNKFNLFSRPTGRKVEKNWENMPIEYRLTFKSSAWNYIWNISELKLLSNYEIQRKKTWLQIIRIFWSTLSSSLLSYIFEWWRSGGKIRLEYQQFLVNFFLLIFRTFFTFLTNFANRIWKIIWQVIK